MIGKVNTLITKTIFGLPAHLTAGSRTSSFSLVSQILKPANGEIRISIFMCIFQHKGKSIDCLKSIEAYHKYQEELFRGLNFRRQWF